MSLIIIRADSNKKLLNAMADIERHAGLKVQGKPKILDNNYADKMVESILKTRLRNRSQVAVMVKLEQDATLSIMKIKSIHPPAHVVVISEEYAEYETLKLKMQYAPDFKGYYSHKKK
ncbi:MAG: DUF356 domain-containing protein [Euryarchaeota archaeon]|nr:DUF356 domain-containing protein [Euryarchaeota archaeon]MBV1729907.1 DUF356 domain-containing protein [Methanobacterium sp.]MBU4547401.1 DUF356 domain-containing protein [Euryarchaeota archaeon]MBU4607889.1 DUF356 domain-containing protein [Euryarchaeota archaeon]MBV1755795.1 DUF356 domain-containing protein [Methanobacterium sp.]